MNKKTSRRIAGKSGFELTGEALDLLRALPASVLALYYIGTLPFICAFLFFWADMSRSAFAEAHCVEASLGIALLFIWMKCWHAVFGRQVNSFITGEAPPGWTLKTIGRMVAIQTAVQASSFVVLSLALIVLMPFYIVYSFYENVTNLCARKTDSISVIIKQAARLSFLEPRQCNVMIWLVSPWLLGLALLMAFGFARLMVSSIPALSGMEGMMWFVIALIIIFRIGLPISPFGCIVAGNIAILLFLAPYLLDMVLGINISFTSGSWFWVFNTTFIMTVFSLGYLCLDPIVKAAYALRCFYGESITTGKDLIIELDRERSGQGEAWN